MEALVTSTSGLLAIICIVIAVGFYSQNYKICTKLGPALIVIILAVILSNTHVVPMMAPEYGVLLNYTVYISVAMMLLNVNLKDLLSLSKQPVVAILLAVLSVSVVALLAGMVFAPRINEGWKVAGMFVGTYTGGSGNMTAIGMGLDALPETFAVANAADYIVGLPTLIVFFALPGIVKNSKFFAKIWPYKLEDHELTIEDDSDKFLASKTWSITEIAILFAIGFTIVWVAQNLSGMLPKTYQSPARILLITTISISLAQFKQVRAINGNRDLGVFMAMFFICIIGFMVDISGFFSNTLEIALYCAVVIFGSLLLHISLCRLFKIKYQYVIISILAAVADGSTAAILSATAGWDSLVSISILLGITGAILGNYIGIPLAFFLKSLIGV